MKSLNFKKSGFTLMEIAVSVLIVAVLIAVSLPVIRGQLRRSNEYSYYLAYRTVEKLAGQIAALGDPEYGKTSEAENDLKLAANIQPEFKTVKKHHKNKNILTSLSKKITIAEVNLFKVFAPKAYAAETGTPVTLYSSADFEYVQAMIKVCLDGAQIEKGTDETGNPVYYTKNDFNCQSGQKDEDGNTISETDIVYSSAQGLWASPNCEAPIAKPEPDSPEYQEWQERASKSIEAAVGQIKVASSAKSWCLNNKYIKDNCASSKGGYTYTGPQYLDQHIDAYTDDDGEEVEAEDYGICVYYASSNGGGSFTTSDNETWTQTAVASDVCSSSKGYYGMYNAGAPYKINCQCDSSHPVRAENDSKVCCARADGSNGLYYAHSTKTACSVCSGDFNTYKNECFPPYAVSYNNATQEYACASGYEYDSSVNKCLRSNSCPTGMKFVKLNSEKAVCVPAPPLIDAKRFCELIDENWNTSSANCNTFTSDSTSGSKYYSALYDKVFKPSAANSSASVLSSINVTTGAFKNLKPNIVFSNGLRLWILGDRAASIPGLTYDPVKASKIQNMCRNLDKTTSTDCSDAGGTFCAGEYHCMALAGASTLQDARNCCSSATSVEADADDRTMALSGFTVYVDINGKQGDGTLWDDVFPFYVTTTGKVFPGYPLDSNSAAIGGNNSAYLPTDVYYFDVDKVKNARRRVLAFSGISYADAACKIGMVNAYSPYCLNLKSVAGGSNPCSTRTNTAGKKKCFISVRKKNKFL